MKQLITLLLVIFSSILTVKAQQAVYLTTAEKDTVAINMNANPVINREDTKLIMRVNGNDARIIEIREGLKLSFGSELLMGDANRDGVVTKEDATAVTDGFLGKNAKIDLNTADVNLNGKVDMNDANTIVNTVLKKTH